MLNGVRAAILDQVAGRRDAEQDEREPLQRRIGRAVLIEKANAGKEIVGEGQAQRRVDLVDEDDDAFGALDEGDLAQVTREAMADRIVGLRVPPL